MSADNLLENVPLFAGLETQDRDIIARHVVTRTFPKQTVVVNEGDRSDSLYLIVSGKVKVYVSESDGKEVILSMQGPGECFGELALLDHAPRSASVMTTEPTTLCVISRSAFEDCLVKNPDIALNVIRALTQRVRTLTDNVKSLALLDVYGRVARTLLSLSNDLEGRRVIDQRLTHQDIAHMVGASREMVSRIMKDLATGGYLRTEGKRIVINEKLPPGW